VRKESVRMVSERGEAVEWVVAATLGRIFPSLSVLVWVCSTPLTDGG
jgi:hypothetical protein